MTMHFRSTLPAPLPGALPPAALPAEARARRSVGSGPYQESTQELWRGTQVLPLVVSALPGELLLELERQRGIWGATASLQART